MKGKRIITGLLAGILALPMPCTGAAAADFSDGKTQEVLTQEGLLPGEEENVKNGEGDASLFSSGENSVPEEVDPGKEAEDIETFSDGEIQETVDIDNVIYCYNADTDSYYVQSVFSTLGNTIALRDELYGKKVTEIGRKIFDISFQEPPEPYIVVGELIIPDTVTKIAQEAFADGDMISMEIPDSVTEIGRGAFDDCEELRSLYFPAGTKVFPTGLFKNCLKLDTIRIGNGVTKIEDWAMQGCPALREVHIPKSVTEIGENIFSEGADVVIWGEEGSYAQEYAAARGIPFMKEGTDVSDVSQEVWIDGVRYSYQEDTDAYWVTGFNGNISSEVSLQAQVEEKSVSRIAEEVFRKCSRLEKIHIPGTIKEIGAEAFAQCLNLTEVTMEDGVQTLGEKVFDGCRKLAAISMPDSILSIGESGFSYCVGLKEIKLPQGLKRIENSLFWNAAMEGTLTLPEGVESIGEAGFSYFSCKEIRMPDTLKTIEKSAFLCAEIEGLEIPDSVTSVGQNAFMGSTLKTLTLGRGISSVRMGTFQDCQELEEVVLPEGTVEIGKYAFRNTGLYRVYVPASVKRIHKQAFAENSRLTLFVSAGSYGEKYAKARGIPYDSGDIHSSIVEKNGIQYQLQSSTNTYILTKASQNVQGEIVIPEKINGKKVTGILERAFYQCEKAEGIKIPDTVASIGQYAFAHSGIKNVRLPSKLTRIEAYTFLNAPLESVSIPDKVRFIGEGAFSGCYRLTQLKIPDSVTSLGESAFSSCSALKTADLSDKIKTVPALCFEYCRKLRRVELPKSLESIEDSAFLASGLRSVALPDTLKFIGEDAFSSCSALTELTIPGTVKTLDNGSFDGCTRLEKVVLEDGIERLGTVFYACGNLKEIYIPDSVYFISGLKLADEGKVYGNTGSKAWSYCKENGISFVSQGTAVLEQPVILCSVKRGNNVQASLKDRCDNADFYDYVISKSQDISAESAVLYRKEKTESLGWTLKGLYKGAYYIRARSGRNLEDGTIEYSPWSEAKRAVVSIQAPDVPEIQSVKVSGSEVTVTLKETAGSEGYGIVLAAECLIDPSQELMEPDEIVYASVNNKSAVYVFKEVKRGSYRPYARSYKKGTDGKNVYSRWSVYGEYINVGY